ncbi:hypothetical protein HPB52_009059 [Rhipicephalus sanguineus]|uniref:Uncharacterized protein n=1 Tax=Rhipicephalus sanguineus TaxID=34632 RepID=A0A9D4SZV1_RHISA|nr:hypothetical protein HPB52_009059 [Rhipicephalus sanguineus]
MDELCQHLQRLGEEEFTTLCGGATTDELHGALRGMPANSAPGVDGLTAGFYATFLEILGDALLSLVNAILSQCKKPDSFRAGRIVLLLKDRAPITLLNVDYRIVASNLNNRIRLLLPDIISPLQSCAVDGRSV